MNVIQKKFDFEISNIVDAIVDICNPCKIILFGSYARGDNNHDSDVDLCILIKNLKSQKEVYSQVRREFYKKNLVFSFDLIIQDAEKFERQVNNPKYIYGIIEKEGRVIYEHV